MWRLGATPVVMTPRVVAASRRRGAARHPGGEQEVHALRTTQVEIVTDERFEQLAAIQRSVEDLGQTDLKLPDRQAMLVPGSAISSGQRPG